MTKLRLNNNYGTIITPGGNIHVWKNDMYAQTSSIPDSMIFIEIDYDENGGLTLPSGRKVYSQDQSWTRYVKHVGLWSLDNGFLANHRQIPDFAIQDVNGTVSKMSEHDPEIIYLSNLLFDALLNGELPIHMTCNPEYYMERREAVNYYTESFHIISEKIKEMNEFDIKQNKLIHASKPVKLWRRVNFLPRVRVKITT